MTTIKRGFHPWLSAVHRLSKITPHRQIQLLCLISVVTVVVMVSAVLGSLGPTHDSLEFSSRALGPSIRQIDLARDKYVAGLSALQLAVDPDPAVRIAAISRVGSLNASAESAWNGYVRKSVHLPGERELQTAFVTHRKAALDAGSALVSQALPSLAQLGDVTQASDALRLDLNRIKSLYEARVQLSLTSSRQQVSATQRQILLVSGAAVLILLLAFGVAARSARSREERTRTLDQTLHDDAERNELEARLQRALEMVSTEPAAYLLVGRAISGNLPGLPAELLVADSSRAHFRRAVATDDYDGTGCQVPSPTDCAAATWGQTQVWNSSRALDACPYLQNRPTGDCSAVCVPVGIGGTTATVVHATGLDGQPPDTHAVTRIELIARKVGERIGMLRAFARSETQAHTDPLTGLMNRRSLEEQVHEIEQDGSYVAAYGDLDHFKQLNDVYGHDAGDQALRLFARVLGDTVRPNDVTARYGGEEFVVVLPGCTVDDAYAVVDRLRERLALAQVESAGPRFTVSFGIAQSRPNETFGETLEAADGALLDAKAQGRDRVIVAGTDGQGTGISSEPVSREAPTISSTRS